jgi:ATP-dependent metalloprotease
VTAYHEAGHTLVTMLTKHAAPVHKCTILPRGSSLGHTAMLPEIDQHYITRAQLLASLDGLMGGRVAEELIFGGSMHDSTLFTHANVQAPTKLRPVRHQI